MSSKYDEFLSKGLALSQNQFLRIPVEGKPDKFVNAISNYIKNGKSSIAIQACHAKIKVDVLEDNGVALFKG